MKHQYVMRNLSLYLIFLVFSSNLQAQKNAPKDLFSFMVYEEEGDLNHDKKADRIIVEMDTTSATRPLRLRIFLSQPNNRALKQVVSSTKIIEAQYPTEKNGEHSEGTIPDFFVEDGDLQMVTDIRDIKSRYTFKFRNGNLELNHISRVAWIGENTTSHTEIDLLTGLQSEFDQKLGSDEILNKRKKQLKVATLPKIQDLTFSELEKY